MMKMPSLLDSFGSGKYIMMITLWPNLVPVGRVYPHQPTKGGVRVLSVKLFLPRPQAPFTGKPIRENR